MIRFDGAEISGRPSHLIQRKGVVYVPEGRGIFRSLTVEENLLLAMRHLSTRSSRLQAKDFAYELFPALANRPKQRADTLSGGEQQMLALARSYTMDAKLLIVDEPSFGLAPKLVDQVFESLRQATARGITVIIIEQFVDRVLSMSDLCLILAGGAVNWSGPVADARAVLHERYLGSSTSANGPPPDHPSGVEAPAETVAPVNSQRMPDIE
jgi:branched-chain amino acid transport system ATP-binding protein